MISSGTAIIILSVLCALFAAFVAFLLVLRNKDKISLEKERKETSLLLSTTAHDLRSPLAAIKGFADTILDGKTDADKTAECLAVISCEANRLARLTERLTAEKVVLRTSVFDVCEHIRRAQLLTERKTKGKNIQVSFLFDDFDSFYIEADNDAVFEVIYNLFENAAKYCPENGKIAWDVCESNGETVIFVKNTAIEVPKTDIFAAGKRGKNLKESGHGLGLFVSQKLISAHGKTLQFYNENFENEAFVTFTFSMKSALELEI